MTIAELVKELDTKLKEANAEQVRLHSELVPLANRLIEGDELKRAEEIAIRIQESYNEMHPALNFIGGYYKFACDFAKSHQGWVEKLQELNPHTGDTTQKGTIIH